MNPVIGMVAADPNRIAADPNRIAIIPELAGVLLREIRIGIRSGDTPAKADVLPMNNAVTTMDMTREMAVAGPSRGLLAGVALRRTHQAEAVNALLSGILRKAPLVTAALLLKAFPAGVVLLPMATQVAAIPPATPVAVPAIPDSNATKAGSSPAAVAVQDMAAEVAVLAAQAVAPVAAAAPVVAKWANDTFHHIKQIELATALFVCSKII
jgi:hypothetical protein